MTESSAIPEGGAPPERGTGPAPADGELGQGPAGPDTLLELSGISRRFGAIQALANVSLDVGRSECVAIVGDNGAGKSTLVKVMSGVVRPDEGHMTFNGAPLEPENPRDVRGAGIETVYQDLALADHLNPVSNIFLGRELAVGWPRPLAFVRRRQMRAKVADLIERTGVNIPSLTVSVRQMSGGQRQGLAIARALAWDAKLIILDEPTAALGVRETAQVESLIQTLSSHGVAVVLVSHNMQQVFRVARRVFVMRHGRCVGRRAIPDTHEEEVVGMITGAIRDEAGATAASG